MSEIAGSSIRVKIDNLYLDPNNPRLGEIGPGYKDPEKIFNEDVQKNIFSKMTGDIVEKKLILMM